MLKALLQRFLGSRRTILPASPPRPLPPALGERLRSIARQEVLCRDVDRSWAELAREELAPEEAAPLRRHLARCQRCTAVYAVLEAAVLEPPLPLPAALTFRLHGVGRSAAARRPRLPAFIRDIRYTAAASYLGALLVVAVVGNPVEAGARSVEALRQPIGGLVTRATTAGNTGLQAMDTWWETVRTETSEEFEKRRRATAAAQQQRWQEWQLQIESLVEGVRSRVAPDEGEGEGAESIPPAAEGGAAAPGTARRYP